MRRLRHQPPQEPDGTAIEIEQRPSMDREHRPTETVIPRHEVPQPAGQRKHPVAHRDGRDDLVHQMRAVDNAVRAPGRTETPPWAPVAVTEDPLRYSSNGTRFREQCSCSPSTWCAAAQEPGGGADWT
jgi:hypothetical protein